MAELFQKGGPLLWVILLCSIIALGTFLERLFFLHRATMGVGDFLKGLSILIERKNFSEAIQECACTPGPVARVLHSALLRHEASRSELREIVQDSGQLEVSRLEKNLPLLSTIAYAAPLVGLLGTVLGLLQAFQAITVHGSYTTTAELASGAYQSLLCAAAGIAVSIPAFVAYKFLSSRVNSLMRDMERAGIEIVHLLTATTSAPPHLNRIPPSLENGSLAAVVGNGLSQQPVESKI
jgi:biopolymer transport protein ExbB